jgi:hypothetical protein
MNEFLTGMLLRYALDVPKQNPLHNESLWCGYTIVTQDNEILT